MTKHQAPEVTSEDRKAVARFYGYDDGRVRMPQTPEHARLAEAFAAHRTRATQPQSLTIDDGLIARLRDCANGIGSFKTDRGDFGLCDDAADRLQSLSGEQIAENANCSGEAVRIAERDACAKVASAHRAPKGVPQIDYDQACDDIEAGIRARSDRVDEPK